LVIVEVLSKSTKNYDQGDKFDFYRSLPSFKEYILKVSIFEEQARTYRLLQKVLIAQNKPNEALEIAERGRARALVDLLSQQLSPSQVSISIASIPNLNQIKQIATQQNSTLLTTIPLSNLLRRNT